jgi:hypothetical protein
LAVVVPGRATPMTPTTFSINAARLFILFYSFSNNKSFKSKSQSPKVAKHACHVQAQGAQFLPASFSILGHPSPQFLLY